MTDVLDSHTERGRPVGFGEILEEFRRSLLRELDYGEEAQNLLTLGRNLAEFERIVVPEPIADYTTARALTMTYIRGMGKEDRKLYFEAIEEHHVVDMVRPEIKGTDAGSDEFPAKAKVLKELIEHHTEEEETEMFPRARKLMDREALVRLGVELVKAKESMTGGIITRLAGLVGL
ncbi:MAG TPA: AarF/UbiB family protein [Candidatus Limnocylindrales bacterium]|nr:AarF/UbiB family protein [Candidatus Limnocylindrales bacterium]